MLATTSTRFCHLSAIGGFSDGETWFHWFDEDQGAEDLRSHSVKPHPHNLVAGQEPNSLSVWAPVGRSP
jgi:hypothetical protein